MRSTKGNISHQNYKNLCQKIVSKNLNANNYVFSSFCFPDKNISLTPVSHCLIHLSSSC